MNLSIHISRLALFTLKSLNVQLGAVCSLMCDRLGQRCFQNYQCKSVGVVNQWVLKYMQVLCVYGKKIMLGYCLSRVNVFLIASPISSLL